MGLFDRLLRRVENPASASVRADNGFVHAPDASPDDVMTPRRKERPVSSGHTPAGWKRVLGQGTALGPWHSDAEGGGDGASSDGGSGGF